MTTTTASTRPGQDWWVVTGMTVAAASAAVASFSGLRGLAEAAGWPGNLAWLLPVTVDAYAMTSARVWLATSTGSRRARTFARTNALGAITASIAGNAAYHAIGTGLLAVSWLIIVVVGAVPAAVLGLTAHLHALHAHTDPNPNTGTVPSPVLSPVPSPARGPGLAPSPAPVPGPAPRTRSSPPPARPTPGTGKRTTGGPSPATRCARRCASADPAPPNSAASSPANQAPPRPMSPAERRPHHPMTSPTRAPRPILDLAAVRDHPTHARDTVDLDALWTALADVPVLLAEIERLRSLLWLARASHADLLAAARASVAADHDGEHDPLWYVRDELAARAELRPRWTHAAPGGGEETRR
jgi:hypothetical protein